MRVQTLLSITAAAISLALAKDSNEELNNIDKSLSRARNEKRKFSSVFYKHPFYIIQNGGGICQVKHNSNTNTDEKSRSKSTPDIVSHISAASSSDATARFNYASTDCAATVVGYNQGAKSVNSILISNKDNYLSNPCAASRKYVIIELCEEIKIDLISMANYEFFSSTFRKLRFSGSDKLLTSPDSKAWGLLGEVEASNTRVLQSFAVKTGFFVKYLLVEILSHWSNEFICPISIVIVNGKTMIEEFKIDMEQKKTNDEATSNIPNSISVDNITVIIESTDNNGQQHLIPYSGYCKIPKYGLVHPTSSIYIRKEDSVTSHSQPNINNNNNSNNLVNNTALPPEDRANIFKSIDHRIKAIEESQIKVLESFSTAEKRLEALVAKLEHKLVKFVDLIRLIPFLYLFRVKLNRNSVN